jgi:pimeloyl-ACP methyl ester carboxylesterase
LVQAPWIVFWGSQDPVFVPAGGDAYKRDIPSVKVKHLNAGHFLLETHLVNCGFTITVGHFY